MSLNLARNSFKFLPDLPIIFEWYFWSIIMSLERSFSTRLTISKNSILAFCTASGAPSILTVWLFDWLLFKVTDELDDDNDDALLLVELGESCCGTRTKTPYYLLKRAIFSYFLPTNCG